VYLMEYILSILTSDVSFTNELLFDLNNIYLTY